MSEIWTVFFNATHDGGSVRSEAGVVSLCVCVNVRGTQPCMQCISLRMRAHYYHGVYIEETRNHRA